MWDEVSDRDGAYIPHSSPRAGGLDHPTGWQLESRLPYLFEGPLPGLHTLDQQCGCCWWISLPNGPMSLENQKQDVLNKVIILPPSCAGREEERGKGSWHWEVSRAGTDN